MVLCYHFIKMNKIAPLYVAYPPRNAVIKNGLPGLFIYGALSNARAGLKINGIKAHVYKTGAYIAYIPARAGNFDFKLEFDDGKKQHAYTHPVFIEMPPPPQRLLAEYKKTAVVTREGCRPRPTPQSGKNLPDTYLTGAVEITGETADFYRLRLTDGKIAWAEKDFFSVPQKRKTPQNRIKNISVREEPAKTLIKIENTRRVSFTARERKNSFDISLYYSGGAAVKVFYKKGQILWGCNYKWRSNDLIFEFYHQPLLPAADAAKPLKGLKVFLDPGHSPKQIYAGESKPSPHGLWEYKFNYKIALAARRALAVLGARVILSKTLAEQMPLQLRAQKAKDSGAHIFISLHNNSWPDNVNPLKRKNGSEIYYYHPHSAALARAIDASYARNIPLPSEGVKHGDFYVLRNTPQIPAVLIENAYISLPQHEELLMKPSFIKRLADAITGGVLGFFKHKNN
jgi:N-acetylmuramoyl-L-alanine amidase